jgi:hypothetical protein
MPKKASPPTATDKTLSERARKTHADSGGSLPQPRTKYCVGLCPVGEGRMLKSVDDIPALIAMMINKDECSDRHVDVMKLKGYSHFPGPSISVDGSDQPVPTIAVVFKDQNSPQMGRWKRFLEAFGIDNAIPKIDRVAHNSPYGWFAAKLADKPAHCQGLVEMMKRNECEVSFAVNLVFLAL